MTTLEKVKVAPSFADAVIAHMSADADTTPLNFGGETSNTKQLRADHVKKLRHYRGRLDDMLEEYGPKPRESAKAWADRTMRTSPRREDKSTLAMVGRLHAIIERIDDEAELQALKEADEEKARAKAELDGARRRANPDAKVVKQLVATIEVSAAAETLLANVFKALAAHKQAQEARATLDRMFHGVHEARTILRLHGEDVSEELPKRPSVAVAPREAVAFAQLLESIRIRCLGPMRTTGRKRSHGECSMMSRAIAQLNMRRMSANR